MTFMQLAHSMICTGSCSLANSHRLSAAARPPEVRVFVVRPAANVFRLKVTWQIVQQRWHVACTQCTIPVTTIAICHRCTLQNVIGATTKRGHDLVILIEDHVILQFRRWYVQASRLCEGFGGYYQWISNEALSLYLLTHIGIGESHLRFWHVEYFIPIRRYGALHKYWIILPRWRRITFPFGRLGRSQVVAVRRRISLRAVI